MESNSVFSRTGKIGRREGDSDLSITSMITGRIGRHEVLFFITVTISERKNTFRTDISDRDNV